MVKDEPARALLLVAVAASLRGVAIAIATAVVTTRVTRAAAAAILVGKSRLLPDMKS